MNELEIIYTTRGKCADIDDKRRTIFSSGTQKLRNIHHRSSTTDTSRFRYWRTLEISNAVWVVTAARTR